LALIKAKARGAAVIFVTQRPGLMMVMDQTLVLQNGKISQFRPRAEIMRGVMKKEQGVS
jgi:ATP-binding cassette subfamily C protein